MQLMISLRDRARARAKQNMRTWAKLRSSGRKCSLHLSASCWSCIRCRRPSDTSARMPARAINARVCMWSRNWYARAHASARARSAIKKTGSVHEDIQPESLMWRRRRRRQCDLCQIVRVARKHGQIFRFLHLSIDLSMTESYLGATSYMLVPIFMCVRRHVLSVYVDGNRIWMCVCGRDANIGERT